MDTRSLAGTRPQYVPYVKNIKAVLLTSFNVFIWYNNNEQYSSNTHDKDVFLGCKEKSNNFVVILEYMYSYM